MSSIKEIAKLAGVGVGTVSRVINNSEHVTPETRQKVMEIMETLNYRPNKAARSLVRGNSAVSTIGVVLPNIAHAFFFEVIKGIYAYLKEKKYNIQLFTMGIDRKTTFEHIVDANLASIMIFAESLTPEEKMKLKLNNTNFIYIDYLEQGENSIYFDNDAGGEKAAKYLLDEKCSKIIYVGTPEKTQQQDNRYGGFKRILDTDNMRIEKEYYINLDEELAYQISKKIIQNNEADGIFYFCDEMAYGGIRAKKELGSDIKMVGYDDLAISKYIGLTTIRQQAEELGKNAAEIAIKLISDDAEKEKYNVKIIPELIKR